MSQFDFLKDETKYKPIPSYPNFIVGLDNSIWTCIARNGRGGPDPNKWRKLTPKLDKDGYFVINLRKNNQAKTRKLHKLIYESFIGPIENGLWVLHKDDVKTHNHPSNLYLGTIKENTIDRTKNNPDYCAKGEDVYNAIITNAYAKNILIMFYTGIQITEIAKKLNISKSIVFPICNDRTFKNINRLEIINEIIKQYGFITVSSYNSMIKYLIKEYELVINKTIFHKKVYRPYPKGVKRK